MVCDVSTVLNNDGAVLELSDVVSVSGDACGADVSFENGVSVSGKIIGRNGVLELSAHVEGRFAANCARCLKSLEREISFDFEETLAQETAEVSDRDSVIIFEGNQIDLGEIVISNLLLNLSYKYLCKEDCKGLCPKCGKDLNLGDCGCDLSEIDPRWEKLKNFK